MTGSRAGLMILFLVMTVSAHAQKHWRLSGVITHAGRKTIELEWTNELFKTEMKAITIEQDGHFSCDLFVDNYQEVRLIYGEDFVQMLPDERGQTRLTWDGADFIGTIQDSSHKGFNYYYLHFQQRFYAEPAIDSAKSLLAVVDTISALNKAQFKYLADHAQELDSLLYKKAAYDIYFNNLNRIISSPYFQAYSFAGLLTNELRFPFIVMRDEKYLQAVKTYVNALPADARRNAVTDTIAGETQANVNYLFRDFMLADTLALRLSIGYRSFLHTYFQSFRDDIVHRAMGKASYDSLRHYAQLLHALLLPRAITDWLLAVELSEKIIYSGAAAVPSFDKDVTLITTPWIKEKVLTTYHAAARFGKGMVAPGFSAKDINNKTVHLADFKGKYVFLMCWASWCSPCLYNFRQYNEPVYRKYKNNKEVVFLYISFDDNLNAWKNAVKKYQPAGVNLIADKGMYGQVAKDYGLNYVPHYILIGKDGTFINYNVPDMDYIVNEDPLNL